MKTNVHFLHGFNVKDGGRETIGKLYRVFRDRFAENVSDEQTVEARFFLHDLGLVGLLDLRKHNRKLCERLSRVVSDGDIIIAHSNGSLLVWDLIHRHGVKPQCVILINPALRRDAEWDQDVVVYCYHSEGDWTVELGRMWSRFVTRKTGKLHGWGAAGRRGFSANTRNVINVSMSDRCRHGDFVATGHSDVFSDEKVVYWSDDMIARMKPLFV